MGRFLAAVLFTVLLGLPLHAQDGEVPEYYPFLQPLEPQNVKFNVAPRHRSLLPFQAVHVKFVLKNSCETVRRLGPIERLEQGRRYVGLRRDGKGDFRPVGDPISWVDFLPEDDSRRVALNERQRRFFYLEPGMATAYSITLAADWFSDDKYRDKRDLGIPMFPEPGKYELKFEYPLDVKKKKFAEEIITVSVYEPLGDDKKIYDQLKADPKLASIMMSPVHVPSKALVSKLKKIMNDYPDSSYSRYARFALVRKAIHGTGEDGLGHTEDVMELLYKVRPTYAYSTNERYILNKIAMMRDKELKFGLRITCAEFMAEIVESVPEELWDRVRKYWPDSFEAP